MKEEVTFTEEDHKYQDNTGQIFTSVTTLIGKYKQPFDSEYWSLYKAIERIVVNSPKAGQEYFNREKKKVGYMNIIPHFLPKIKNKQLLLDTIIDILWEWEEKKRIACKKGTAYHKNKEEEVNEIGTCIETGLKIILKDDRPELMNLTDSIYTELIMWNKEYILAGQADKVTLIDQWIDIDDYKTSKKIDLVSFKHYEKGHIMMKKPLENIMDCNHSHYTLQLSLYGWMLEQQTGYKVRRLRLYHTITDTYITVPYKKAEIEKLLYYNKQIV